jgi:peptidoglycan/xylan/chitin deacetylase (PgdA/CDA1 family)
MWLRSSIVFLMYHKLERPGRVVGQSKPWDVRYILSEMDFQEHLKSLRARGWCGWSVGQALRGTAEPGVVITFDDGCDTDLLMAAPLLRKYAMGATFYVTAGFVGKKGYLTVQQLRELYGLGFEIGCHSMTHPYLSDLDMGSLRNEVADAKAQLEQWLGTGIEHFSCPGGRYSRHVKMAVREAGYSSMATSRNHANGVKTDRFELGRVAVLRGTGVEAFERLSAGRGLWRLNLGYTLRQAAKRALGNSMYDRVRGAFLGEEK